MNITEILKQNMGATLNQKMWHFWNVLDVFYHKYDGKVYIAFSGGMDSTVMVDLADKWTDMMGYKRIPLVFNNTTNEYQEILDFVKTYGDIVS